MNVLKFGLLLLLLQPNVEKMAAASSRWKGNSDAAFEELQDLCRPALNVVVNGVIVQAPIEEINANMVSTREAMDEDMALPEDSMLAHVTTAIDGSWMDVHIQCGKTRHVVEYGPEDAATPKFRVPKTLEHSNSVRGLALFVAQEIVAAFGLQKTAEDLVREAATGVQSSSSS